MKEKPAVFAVHLKPVCVGTICRAVPHSPNTKQHWAGKYKWTQAWKDEVFYAIKELTSKPSLQKKARITFELRTISPQDFDNSMASIKPLLDGMKGLVIVDDSPEHIYPPKVKTIKVKTKAEQGVSIFF